MTEARPVLEALAGAKRILGDGTSYCLPPRAGGG